MPLETQHDPRTAAGWAASSRSDKHTALKVAVSFQPSRENICGYLIYLNWWG